MDIRKINFTIIIAVFAVVMSGVMLTAIISYSSMVRINRQVDSDAASQQQLFLLGSLMVELQQAENSTRGYRLIRAPERMEAFYLHSEACSNHIGGLMDISAGDEEKLEILTELSVLIQQKLETMEELSRLTDRSAVVSELQRISSRLDQQAHGELADERPRNFIRNLFSRERNNTARLDSLQAQMQAEIENTRRAQSTRLREIDAVEFAYLEKINTLGTQIESLMAALRLDALNMVETVIAEREKQQIASNRKIRIFSAAAGLFILLGGVAVWIYAKTRRQYEEALRQAKHHAEMYVGMQERFIANMSHEVRTPLHAIAGFTEQFMQSDNAQRKEEYRGLVHSAMKHLLQVVDDILDYAKLMAGKMKIRMEPFVPLEEVAAVTGIFSEESRRKGLGLLTDKELPGNEAVFGDALRYRQVLMNLVSNAIKFTDQGDVRIRVYRQVTEGGRHMLATEVSDEGIGISEAHIGKLFMPFEQLANEGSGTYRGTGLGLAISREIIELQGGSIILESEPGAGTRVVFSLPYLKTERSSADSVKMNTQGDGFLKGLHILIADDEHWNSRLVAAMLSKHGPDLTIVEDGNRAYDELKNKQYDIALLDVRMPGMSGLEVAALARKESMNPDAILIALTAQALHEQGRPDTTQFLDASLTKPFAEDQLLDLLRHFIQRPRAHAHQPDDTGPSGSMKISENDEEKPARVKVVPGRYSLAMNKIAGEDIAFAREMAALFVKNTSKSLHEIQLAVTRNDHDAIAWHIHKMKPALIQLHAGRMLSILHDMDSYAEKEQSAAVFAPLVKELDHELNIIVGQLINDFDLDTDS